MTTDEKLADLEQRFIAAGQHFEERINFLCGIALGLQGEREALLAAILALFDLHPDTQPKAFLAFRQRIASLAEKEKPAPQEMGEKLILEKLISALEHRKSGKAAQ